MNEDCSTAAARDGIRHKIARPVFIVSTPRSGSTLLFETLIKAPDLFNPGGESHMRIEQVADFFPGARGWTSNRLTEADAAAANVEDLARRFYPYLRDRSGHAADGKVQMLEKTPKNALRVPFFNAAWPDSLFVYLYREPQATLGSMIEAWLSGRFVTYPMLPAWGRPAWSLLLIPGWRELAGKPLAEVVAAQWARTTSALIQDLSALPPERVIAVAYDDLVKEPQRTMTNVSARLGLGWDVTLPSALPFSKTTFSRPAQDKWRRFEAQVDNVRPMVEASDEQARALLELARV